MNRRDLFKATIGSVVTATGGAGGAVIITQSHPELTAFATFVADVQRLAWADGACPQGEFYCDAEAWRDSFNDGLTPKEAWQEERRAAAWLLG